MPPNIVINDLTVLKSCVIFLPPVYPLHMCECACECVCRCVLFNTRNIDYDWIT